MVGYLLAISLLREKIYCKIIYNAFSHLRWIRLLSITPNVVWEMFFSSLVLVSNCKMSKYYLLRFNQRIPYRFLNLAGLEFSLNLLLYPQRTGGPLSTSAPPAKIATHHSDHLGGNFRISLTRTSKDTPRLLSGQEYVVSPRRLSLLQLPPSSHTPPRWPILPYPLNSPLITCGLKIGKERIHF